MEAVHLQHDFVGCCISGDGHPYSPQLMHEKRAIKLKPRARLVSRMPKGLRRSSRDLMSSFTSSVTSNGSAGSGSGIVKSNEVSPTDAARLVAAEYFANQADRAGDAPPQLKLSGAGEFDELCTMPSLLDDTDTHDRECVNVDNQFTQQLEDIEQEQDTATTVSESRHSMPSVEDSVALEVGRSAHEYLEDCFYTEVSVLDREKFDAIPEIVKSDFTIMGHLGKGSYSDVFEVVCKNGKLGLQMSSKDTPAANRRRPSRARRASSAVSSSFTTATLARPPRCDQSRRVLAMKCLRPQIRSDAEQFTIGAEDLVHETAILANLSHPNIIKLHGRASGSVSDAFVLNDGYFILLDRLEDTLSDRIELWRRDPRVLLQGPTTNQLEVARTIAGAVSYLHSKNILFRDLKPANVGFDPNGVLKLFDFGFAVGLPERDEANNPSGLLYDRCGTPRYMAPEVGLSLGYGLPADVYSFGMLFWEICSLDKPFSYIRSADEFDKAVFVGNERPPVEDGWPASVGELMRRCWSARPGARPRMIDVASALSAVETKRGDIERKAPVRPVRSRMTRGRRLSVTGW